MQVKDGSWYQCRDKRIVKAGNVRDGAARLEDVSGKFVAWVRADCGRELPPTHSDCRADLIREVSDPTKPLQLRVGGKYLRADGTEYEIDGCRSGSQFPFYTRTNSYEPNGQCGSYPGGLDLICEILDQPEPELVLEAGKYYERKDSRKCYCIGENPFAHSEHHRVVMAVESGTTFAVSKDGCYGVIGTEFDIVLPWIDPPTEFAFNGKRYRVGEEIK